MGSGGLHSLVSRCRHGALLAKCKFQMCPNYCHVQWYVNVFSIYVMFLLISPNIGVPFAAANNYPNVPDGTQKRNAIMNALP